MGIIDIDKNRYECIATQDGQGPIKLASATYYSVVVILLMAISAATKIRSLGYVCAVLSLYGIVNPWAILPAAFISTLSGEYFLLFKGFGISRVMIVSFLLGVLFKGITLSRQKKMRTIDFLFILMIVSFAASYLVAVSRSFMMIAMFIYEMAIIYIASRYKITDTESRWIVKNIIIGAWIVLISIIISTMIDPHIVFGRIYFGDDANSNNSGMMLVQLFAALLGGAYLFAKTRMYVYFLALPMTMYLIILTGSRTALISVLFCVVLFIIIAYGHTKGAVIKISAIGIVLLVIGSWGFDYLQKLSIFAERFSFEAVAENGGTGRLENIKAAFRYVIPKNFLLGVGPSGVCEQIAIAPYTPIKAASPHNFFVSRLVEVGIFGFSVYMYFYYLIIKRMFGRARREGYMVFPLLMICTSICNGIGEVVFSENFFWMNIAVALIFLNVGNEPQKEIDVTC